MAPKARKPKAINPQEFATGTRTDLNIAVYQDALGNDGLLPFVVVRGGRPGPTVGICAAVHGNELNGISIIHHILNGLDAQQMAGNLICAPIVNAPAFIFNQRRFPEDDIDLNHVFPGKKDGKPAEQYAAAFTSTFLPHCDYLIDIHTASEGRVNTLYVRADLHSPDARRLAELVEPYIILHGRSGDGTLRSAARRKGIAAITVEAGNPSEFQGHMIIEGETGILNIMHDLGMIATRPEAPAGSPPVICSSSKWLRTTIGGLMHFRFDLGERVEKKQPLVDLVDAFGNTIKTYTAPQAGIVIGMARSPAAVPGTRFCHLGKIGEPAGRS